MNFIALLRFVSQQHETEFAPAGQREGYQGGVQALIEPATGRRAVLKVAPGTRAQSIAEILRKAGYPTPRILFCGVTPEGVQYHVQEFVPGEPMERLTKSLLEQLLAINDLQANINIDTNQNLLRYVPTSVRW